MKFIRLLLICLVLALALVAVLALVAIAPAVQTWVAQRALAGRTGVQGSLESLSAGFGEVDVENLRMESKGAVLTLPSLQAKLPITTAAVLREVRVKSLVAKGWTLDLSRTLEPAALDAQLVPSEAVAVSVREVTTVLRGILREWKLPFDASLDGIDLEGDVLLAAVRGGKPIKVHVTASGGGLSAGHEGALAFDAVAADPGSGIAGLNVHGSVAVGMDSPRAISRLGIKAAFSGLGGSHLEDVTLSAEVAIAPGAREEAYTIDVSRGSRQIARLLCHLPESTRRLEGTWNVDVRDSDLASFLPDRPLPSLSATGNGRFDADPAFARVHVLGGLVAMAGRLGFLARPLDALGTVTLDTRLDVTLSGRSARVDRLSISVAGARPVAVVQALQPFDFDARSGVLTVADPGSGWLDASIRGLPLAWLSGLTGGRTIAGGDVTGEFVVQAAKEGFTLRQKAPITAAGVSLESDGIMLARGLDLSLSLSADYAPTGWRLQWAPLALDAAGRRLATLDGTASRQGGTGQPIVISGKWSADLEALPSEPRAADLYWVRGRSASGDFSAHMGASAKIEGTVLVVGHDPGNSLAASVHADVSAKGAVTFELPIKITSGLTVSDIAAYGTWAGDKTVNWVDAKVTGGNVDLGHLRLLAAALAAVGGVPHDAAGGIGAGGPPAPMGLRDRAPFWGDWTGHVTVAFDHLRTEEEDLSYVGGIFDIDGGSIQMTGGRGGFNRHLLTNIEGSVSFDAGATFPYSAKAAAALAEIDAAPLFAAPLPGQDPVFEGHFAVQGKLAGDGINLADLMRRTTEEFRFTSAGGIMRLLRSNLAESLPEDSSSSVSDTLGTVGSAVGSVFGLGKDSGGSGKSSISKNADAALNFTYQVAEIGYDTATVTAVRESDGTIRIVDMEMTAPDEHLKGSGQIAYAKGTPLAKRPLSVELQFGARGRAAELLTAAGLLSSNKDKLGYALLNDPVRFGGTLEHIDESQWTGLLVKAATRKPAGGKKGG